MKKLIVLLILIMAVTVNATDLRWNASTGEVNGYNIQITGGTTSEVANVGNVTEVLDVFNYFGLEYATTYTFTATAYNDMGESGVSNSATYTTPEAYTPLPPWVIPIKKEVPPIIINFILE